MISTLKPLASIFSINSTLLLNAFKDVDEKIALKRPNKKTNSMMFILLHTIDARYFILQNIGVKIKNPFAKYVNWSNTINDIKDYPKLSRVLNDWKKLDGVLIEKFNRLTTKKIESKIEMDFPGGNKILSMIAFMSEHEAYHVGQLAFIRKYLGLKSVTF